MKETEFHKYLKDRQLAEKTCEQRIYALKRIERNYNIDLDVEFDRNQLSELIAAFTYSSADAREGRPNPSKMEIDSDKLASQLPWYRTHINSYRMFRIGNGGFGDSIGLIDSQETIVEESVSQTFGLEKDLQLALRANISQIEAGMQIADQGVERHVEAGFIDICAKDRNGVWTVIELKAGIAKPEAIAQILGYMGSLAEEENAPVRGILIAADHAPRVRLAAKALQNLSLKSYKFKFEFN